MRLSQKLPLGENRSPLRLVWEIPKLSASRGREKSDVKLEAVSGERFYTYVDNNPINANDPMGLETKVIITRDPNPLTFGLTDFGSHAAVYLDNSAAKNGQVLFDPAGSYTPINAQGVPIPRGSGEFFYGSEANLNSYVKYQESLGSKVNIYTFPTSSAEETSIVNRIVGDTSPAYTGIPGFCAISCAGALRGVGPFENLGTVRTPGGLESEMIKLQQSPIPNNSNNSLLNFNDFGGSSVAGGGFVLYPSKPNTNQLRSVYSK